VCVCVCVCVLHSVERHCVCTAQCREALSTERQVGHVVCGRGRRAGLCH